MSGSDLVSQTAPNVCLEIGLFLSVSGLASGLHPNFWRSVSGSDLAFGGIAGGPLQITSSLRNSKFAPAVTHPPLPIENSDGEVETGFRLA